MSAIDYLHITPEDRYVAASVANDASQRWPTRSEFARLILFVAAFCLISMGLIALGVWIYLPASTQFSFTG